MGICKLIPRHMIPSDEFPLHCECELCHCEPEVKTVMIVTSIGPKPKKIFWHKKLINLN